MARHPDDLEMEFGIGTFPFARGSGVTKQAAAQGLEYTLDLPRGERNSEPKLSCRWRTWIQEGYMEGDGLA